MIRLVSILLRPPAAFYERVVTTRRRLYERGWLPRTRVGVPVISVGNVAVGGTGKTPIVAALARRMRDAGERVAVLSRGYGRRSRGRILVSDGVAIRAGAAESGDEPQLLARELPGVFVVVAEDRASAARWIERSIGVDVILLDDGLQHLRLERSLDVVVVDATRGLDGLRVLPAGPLREPLSALSRADLILLTRCHLVHDEVGLRRQLRRHAAGVQVLESGVRFLDLRGLAGDTRSLDALAGSRVVTVSAIGNPDAFEADVRRLGGAIARSVRFRDHHPFSRRDVERIERVAIDAGAAFVVTTTKDLIRLEGRTAAIPIYALRSEATLPVPDDLWRRWMRPRAQPVESSM